MMTTMLITSPAHVPPNIVFTASENGAVESASFPAGRMPKTAVSESM